MTTVNVSGTGNIQTLLLCSSQDPHPLPFLYALFTDAGPVTMVCPARVRIAGFVDACCRAIGFEVVFTYKLAKATNVQRSLR